jgi:hypothetical protein
VTGIAYVWIIAVGIVAFWYLVAPESAWRVLRGRRYSRLSKHVPADRAFTLYRVAAALILVAMVINLVVLTRRTAERDAAEAEYAEAEYQECLAQERAADEAGGGIGMVPPDSPCWELIPEGED